MSNPRTDSILLTDVVKYLAEGDYRIPRFQRNYVWKIDKVVDLIDSLLKGFPIGSIVLWQTKNQLTEVKGLGGVQIPQRDPGRYTSYVIDGQQRLTSLYFALKGLSTSTIPAIDCSKICISLTAASTQQIVYKEIPAHADPNDFVCLKSLWDASGLNGSHQEQRIRYYQLLMGYSITAIKIDDEKLGLAEVVEIFERINLGGKTLNLFSIIAASSYIPNTDDQVGFDLTSSYELLSRKIAQYGTIKDTTLLQIVSACIIKKSNKSSILKELTSVDISQYYEKIEKAFLRAIDHLKGNLYGVCVKSLLPYESLLVPFSYFFYKQGNKQLSVNQQKYLSDYFWRSNITNRFGSSTDTTINADLTKMDAILADQIPQQELISLSPVDIIKKGNTSLTSAFSKAMLCLMYTRTPKSFAPGREIFISNNPQSDSAEKQLHHFFPQKSSVILNNQGYKDKVNNIVNVVFMDALTNQQIGNENPSDYVKNFDENNEGFNSILNTHFIDLKGFGIEEDDFNLFLKDRSEAMYAELLLRLVITENDNIVHISDEDSVNHIDVIDNSSVEDISLVPDVDIFETFAQGKGVKNVVVKYLQENGIYLSDAITYAVFQEDKNVYWANPIPSKLETEWTIILNNHISKKITVIIVPAGTFVMNSSDRLGLFTRPDTSSKIDLNIRVNTLCDRKSNLDFTPYVQYVLDYSQN